MKMFNETTSKVEELPKLVNVNGVNKYSSKLSQEQLAELGYFKIVKESKPSREYYTSKEVGEVVDGVYKVTYETTEKPLEQLVKGLLTKVSKSFKEASNRPAIDSGLGFKIDGSLDDMQRFEIGRELEIDVVIDAFGQPHSIELEDYATMILAIKTSGLKLFRQKWSKEAEIKAFESIEDVINYEKFEYEVEQLIVDEDGEAILDDEGNEQFETVTKTRNMCSHWEDV